MTDLRWKQIGWLLAFSISIALWAAIVFVVLYWGWGLAMLVFASIFLTGAVTFIVKMVIDDWGRW
jgi:hypothetical protein